MSETMRVLIVEDRPSDAELVEREVRGALAASEFLRVETREDFVAALESFRPDIILSDYSMPHFDGMEALMLARQHASETPFILVTGSMNEETAVECMKAGAWDYVIKEHIRRVGPAVQSALEKRQLRRQNKLEEDRYRDLVEHSRDLICTHDLDGRILSANPAAVRMLGYAQAELLDMNLCDLLVPSVRGEFDAYIARIRKAGAAAGLLRVRTRSGEERVWEYANSLRTEGLSEPIVRGMARDITERKLAEAKLRAEIAEREKAQSGLRESEARFRLLIERALAGMFVIQHGAFAYANPRLEEIFGYGPGELVGVRADALLLAEEVPKYRAAWDELRAGAPSVSYSARGVRKDGEIVELGIQSVAVNYEGKPSAVGMAQDIGERNRAQAEIKRYIARLEQTAEGTLQAVAKMVEQRDPYTAGHERRVGDLAAAIGVELGLPEHTVKGLRLTGYVHDIGKIAVPAELLSKPTRLTPIEFDLIKSHSQSGYDVLKVVDFPWPLAEAILQHHERLDGSGYPRGLKGDQIILEARVLAVADVVEAMTSHRPYRPGLGIDKALAEIEANSGRFYDAQAVSACARLFREQGYALPE